MHYYQISFKHPPYNYKIKYILKIALLIFESAEKLFMLIISSNKEEKLI